MLDADLLTSVLGIGVLVLVITTTIMLVEFLPASRQRQRRHHPPQPRALSSGAAQAVADARARASVASVKLGIAPPVPGQIIDITDGRFADRQISVDEANAIAAYFAETDPQRVAEVISKWIRADLMREAEAKPSSGMV